LTQLKLLATSSLNHRIHTKLTILLLSCLLLPAAVFSAELKPYSDETGLVFTLPDLQDKTHALPDYRGKVVLVNFWASWCPPCIYEMPELTRLKNQLDGQPFEILAINVGEKKYKVRKFAKLISFNLPVLLDTSKETFDDWEIKTLPTSFLIDSKGTVRYIVRGNPGWQEDGTIKIIEQLISEHTNKTTAH
jgi:thiol-disulfide isomerase/thioredoxin